MRCRYYNKINASVMNVCIYAWGFLVLILYIHCYEYQHSLALTVSSRIRSLFPPGYIFLYQSVLFNPIPSGKSEITIDFRGFIRLSVLLVKIKTVISEYFSAFLFAFSVRDVSCTSQFFFLLKNKTSYCRLRILVRRK